VQPARCAHPFDPIPGQDWQLHRNSLDGELERIPGPPAPVPTADDIEPVHLGLLTDSGELPAFIESNDTWMREHGVDDGPMP